MSPNDDDVKGKEKGNEACDAMHYPGGQVFTRSCREKRWLRWSFLRKHCRKNPVLQCIVRKRTFPLLGLVISCFPLVGVYPGRSSLPCTAGDILAAEEARSQASRCVISFKFQTRKCDTANKPWSMRCKNSVGLNLIPRQLRNLGGCQRVGAGQLGRQAVPLGRRRQSRESEEAQKV